MTLIKTLIVFTLLFCVLFDPVVGTYTWLQYKKITIKHEVQRQIDDGIDQSKLVLLKFTKEEIQIKLRWEHEREFEYNDKMYDVIRSESKGDKVYYWCWYDHKETMLNRQLDEIATQTAETNAKNKEEQALPAPNQETLYCIVFFNFNFSLGESLKPPAGFFDHLYPQIYTQPPTPPPQFR